MAAGLLRLAAEPSPPPLTTAGGFAVPQPGRIFVFPRDHGSHPEFKIEWWYVTGHLWDQQQRRYGFQATFFRSAGPRDVPDRSGTPAFGTEHLHLGHVALLDAETRRFLHQERLNRDGWDASAATNNLRVKNGNWSLTWTGGDPEPLELIGSVRGEAEFRLRLAPAKPLVRFGQEGVSRKGADPSAASHYLTFTRLRAEGHLTLDGQNHTVRGQAWMDHEFSSSQLGPDQVGWDWACIQLNDGREIMCYRMRRRDGELDPFSTLACINEHGEVTHFAAADFRWEPLGVWRSERTGAEYPAAIGLRAPVPGGTTPMDLRIEPLARDQELAGVIGAAPYWEGACRVLDVAGAEIGSAYLELTGYAGDLRTRLR
jgi:predicted secreted hydrolase